MTTYHERKCRDKYCPCLFPILPMNNRKGSGQELTVNWRMMDSSIERRLDHFLSLKIHIKTVVDMFQITKYCQTPSIKQLLYVTKHFYIVFHANKIQVGIVNGYFTWYETYHITLKINDLKCNFNLWLPLK